MLFTNETPYQTAYAPGYQKDCRELIVVIVKATFELPENSLAIPQLAAKQFTIVEEDISTGEPGYSATLYESDYATYKPYCDVILNGCAHADEPVQQLEVGLQVANLNKRFRVIGNRTWHNKTPHYFMEMPISYDNAFGGIDATNLNKWKMYNENIVGTGYSHYQKNIDDMPLPNTEELNHSVSHSNGNYRPMAFGSISRSHPARAKYAGTYDQQWIENRMPFWPDDFDFRFFQSVLADQQIPYIRGGETVTLTNLSPNHQQITFQLPEFDCPVNFIPHHGKFQLIESAIDTLVIEPELNRFIMVGRASYPIKKDSSEIKEVIIGRQSKSWYRRQQVPNKLFYSSLSELTTKSTDGK